ncbi:MAG: ATP-binding protein [Candidatus Sericytochromatia bacterium]
MSLLFQTNQRNIFREHFLMEAKFIKKVLKETYKNQPDMLKTKIKDVSNQLNWNITYWRENAYIYYTGRKPITINKNFLKNLENKQIVFQKNDFPFELIYYIDDKKPESGFIVMKAGHLRNFSDRVITFIIGSILVLLFLGLLLIPYSLYILRPFKNLMDSINKVSQGNFSVNVEVSKNSEFKELADAFNNMTKKVKEMIEQKQRLIADVSHELRSPLTRMRVGLEILSKDPVGRIKYIDKSINEIEQLDKMIESILEISKLELEDKKLKFELIDINDFLIEQIEKNQILFEKNNIKINTSFDNTLKSILIDKNQFERAISNIFSNLIKYSHNNSIIDITTKKQENKLLVLIRDRGEGVKKEDLEKIFDAFYRTDDSRSRKTGGTGLGLAIVKKIIESNNGKVWASIPEDEIGLIINIEFNIVN